MKGEPFFSTVAWPILSKITSTQLQEVIFVAGEMSFFFEEQLVDFTVTTTFFSDRSQSSSSTLVPRAESDKQTVKFNLYGYNAKEAEALQHCLKANVPGLYEWEMSAPHAHLTYFDRMQQHSTIENTHTMFRNVIAEIDPQLFRGMFGYE
jgi:hypothetical protein